MPRDANGNYTLPAGNPVVGGEVISTGWANPTMADLAAEVTNSLDRQGRGGMLAPFKFLDGSNGAPGMTWTNEPTTGFYRAGASDMRATVAGVQRMRWVGTGVEVWDPAANGGLGAWFAIVNAGGLNVPLASANNTFTGTNTFTNALLLNGGTISLQFQTAGASRYGILQDYSSATQAELAHFASGAWVTNLRWGAAGVDVFGSLRVDGVSVRDASILSSGSLADARLSANVPLRGAVNEFMAQQAIITTGSHLTLRDTDGPDPSDRVVFDFNTGVFALYTHDASADQWWQHLACNATTGELLLATTVGMKVNVGNSLGMGGNGLFLNAANTDTFVYDGDTLPHYGLRAFDFSGAPGAFTIALSGYNGLRFFTGGALRFVLDSGGTGNFLGAFQAATLELGHATDTTLQRIAAGRVALEGLEIGYRTIPNVGNSATAASSASGKCYAQTGGITVPDGTFSAGEAFSIYNNTAGNITITQGTGMTLRQAGTANTGNRTLAQRGLATVWFNSTSEAIISGSGLT